jgi:hypothetical protein
VCIGTLSLVMEGMWAVHPDDSARALHTVVRAAHLIGAYGDVSTGLGSLAIDCIYYYSIASPAAATP